VIECTAGGGLYLKYGASRAIIRNAHRSRGSILDEHIEIRGCFLNGNRAHQPSPEVERPDLPGFKLTSNKEPDGTFISGLQFLGVNYLRIDNVTLWNVRAFGALIANASYVDIHDVIVDAGGGADAGQLQTDGLHFKGPLRFVSIDSVKIRVGDDSIALSPNDFETDDISTRNDLGPYVGQGPITDVTVNNVQLMDAAYGIRILSTNERIDRIAISNVVGTVRTNYLLTISHWMNSKSLGNIGRISVDNVSVDRPAASSPPVETVKDARKNPLFYGEFNGGSSPFININDHIETLLLHHIGTRVLDRRPVIRFSPDAVVGMMDVDLAVNDPQRVGRIVELDDGAQIGLLNLALQWQRPVPDEGINPIVSFGGVIEDLNWVSTPPLFVKARLNDRGEVFVEFTQDVKAADFKAGTTIRVDGTPAAISRAEIEAGHNNVVGYLLKGPVHPGATLTWSYLTAGGKIENLSGSPLLSVSEKSIKTH
jgi:hypothetical protein